MDSELLQSFVRVGVSSEEVEQEPRSIYASTRTSSTKKLQSQEVIGENPKPTFQSRRNKSNVVIEQKKPRKMREGYDEVYTDKDRAAAVSFGKLFLHILNIIPIKFSF